MDDKKDALAVVEKVAPPKITDVVDGIKRVVAEYKAIDGAPQNYDLLRYRSGDNGLMLFIYGEKDCNDEDKVIARLKQVIAKYESKKRMRLARQEEKLSRGGLILRLFGK
jgi:hypothetical protein